MAHFIWPQAPARWHGSILLNILLETRLISKFFETLDDLMEFRVQKLWPAQPKLKIFLYFLKLMKRQQTKFYADTKSNSKVIRSKKVKFLAAHIFSLFIDISLFIATTIDID